MLSARNSFGLWTVNLHGKLLYNEVMNLDNKVIYKLIDLSFNGLDVLTISHNLVRSKFKN